MRQKQLIILIGSVLLIISGVWFWQSAQKPKETESLPVDYRHYVLWDGEVEDYFWLTDDMLMTTGIFVHSSSRYVTATTAQVSRKAYVTGKYGADDFAKMEIHDTSKPFGKGKRTVDLKAKLSAYNPNYIFYIAKGILEDSDTGEFYIGVYYIDSRIGLKMADTPDLNKNSEVLFFNLKTGKFKKRINPERISRFARHGNSYLGSIYSDKVTNLDQVVDENQIDFISESGVSFGPEVSKLKIYSAYKLKERQVDEFYYLYWYGEPNSKELAELLAPEGQTDIFQGVTLYGAYSKDGQDHVVESYDELMQWYQEPAADTSQSSQAD